MPQYLPGFKAGGIVRSVAALVDGLKDEFNFKIICGDRDAGDLQPFASEPIGRWCEYGAAKVLRIPPGLAGARMMIRSLRQESYDALYINGIWPRVYSMLPLACRRMGLLPPRRVVLAPRGELTDGAFSLKHKRKLFYLKLSAWLGFYQGIIWHGSTDLEETGIRRSIGDFPVVNDPSFRSVNPKVNGKRETGAIAIAKDMHLISLGVGRKKSAKAAGQLRIVFVSRISPKKNLLGALTLLQNLSGDVLFDVYGPAEDSEYWDRCKKIINTLPANIRVEYKGAIEHERVGEVFAEHDLFLFPTLAENFGHVICEALVAGCPVLLSDQTPWRNLQQKGVGWDVSLDDEERFRAVLQECVDADGDWYASLVARATEYGRMAATDPEIIEDNRRMFRYATGMI
ncbi:MAG: glycosyltransferase [Terracidiphilus sp.]